MEQLSLKFTTSELALKGFFEAALNKPVHLVMTDNSARMLSFRQSREGVVLRLSRVFLFAPGEVLEEAAMFIKRRGGPTPLVTKFLRSFPAPSSRPRKAKARTKGRHHDLASLFEKINAEYFNGALNATISWSRRHRGRVRKRTLGSYSSRSRAIMINPVLDKPEVPSFFVEFIVYHEMLHAVVPVRESGGRRVVHPKEFREKERGFKKIHEALAWERANRALL